MGSKSTLLEQKTVIGNNMQDAMNKAKSLYGEDIDILSSGSLQENGVQKYSLSILLNAPSSTQIKPLPNTPQASSEKNVTNNLQKDLQEITKLLEESGNLDNTKIQEPAILTKKSDKVPANNTLTEQDKTIDATNKNELDAKFKKVEGALSVIKNILWDRGGYRPNDIEVPAEFSEVYNMLIFSQMKRKHIDLYMVQSHKMMPMYIRGKSDRIKEYFKMVIKNSLQVRSETSANAKKKIQMLVGPTGVGKTTTLSKLAASYAFDNSKEYVVRNKTIGIITLDSFKMGAIDQLKTYAESMQLDIKIVMNPIEFTKALQELNGCDYIFIDTAGSSQYDKNKIMRLQEYLVENDEIDINVSLVLPVNLTKEVFDDIYEGFSILSIDDLILTKLDETRYYGPIFSFLMDTKKPLTYFCYGQNIPDDIMTANKDFIVDKLLPTNMVKHKT